jgi:hypothetical protein
MSQTKPKMELGGGGGGGRPPPPQLHFRFLYLIVPSELAIGANIFATAIN